MTSGASVRSRTSSASLDVGAASHVSTAEVLEGLAVSDLNGLSSTAVSERRDRWGPNAVSSHHARFGPVLWHQLRSPLLALLLTAALASYFVGEKSDAAIIGVIVALSVGLGFVNEYRAERAAEALHDQIRHECVVTRDGRPATVDATELVPGDLVDLRLGDVVPADIRLIAATGLACDESLLTGESLPVDKNTEAVLAGAALAELTGCALMGTVVNSGRGRGVVVSTGARTEFGKIAAGLSTHQLDTEFQIGLRKFSMLLVYVAGALTTSIFVVNVVLNKPIMDALLFSLAIAVGITPQLLPAVVSSSLAAGSRRMSRHKVLVKRLVCIEDLGNVDVLFTDKTGTLTAGLIDYSRAVPAHGASNGREAQALLMWGLVATENIAVDGTAVGGNPLDRALWASPEVAAQLAAAAAYHRVGVLPFDHERNMVSVLVQGSDQRLTLVTKGAPEAVLERCIDVPASARTALASEFGAGNRVIAVATRSVFADRPPAAADERELDLIGFLVFLDPPKLDAAEALERLAALGIAVKVVTGDNPAVAVKVCHDLGLSGDVALTGADLGALDDVTLAQAIAGTTVFARVSPEDKARIVRIQRQSGGAVAFLGDGVNDALALHAADVGISVDSATDVAKDAADVILLEKDLDVLADGVAEGRRIFANTIKYVLMGTSSNFGNMFSAAGASLFLSFLPMLPSQILLNNLLYDSSQLAISSDRVDEEQLRQPSHWDLAFIRRFMIFFGPLSSVFDFVTFGVMLWIFHAGAVEFRSGWFVESLATQTLVIFAIRTRRIPFFRSHPSLPLAGAAVGVVAIGTALPLTPLAHALGFRPLPTAFFAALAAMVVGYLVLIEVGKHIFYRATSGHPRPRRRYTMERALRHRAARFSTGDLLNPAGSFPRHGRRNADRRDPTPGGTP
ncbi:magnesium-translocating P-type ATPase [Nocardioides nematodiphilus]|uniref:magnesium-translocating P-type ATPase n=1 Tax=Nocardioides nematodiphilus TaxID=2849669 RepID=UPI001CD94668|nr:magnesium-translocating P-type ATPase [Nocardioides nematodiphilus]MCA1983789.1 magnesium-translocating P-type ATPase [Nocardioides nematodiphilus]